MTTPLNFIDVDDLLAAGPVVVPWLWDGLLAPGMFALLHGDSKVGKSTLAVQLGKAIACGEPFLDLATRPGQVLYVSVEMTHPQVCLNLEPLHPRPGMSYAFRFGVLGAGRPVFKALEDEITTRHAVLVILDTLAMWAAPRLADENDNAGLLREALPWFNLARTTDVCILVIHHARKSGGGPIEAVRGGSSLAALADQVLHYTQPKGQSIIPTRRLISVVGRYPQSPSAVSVNMVLGQLVAHSPKTPPAPLQV